jgi:hypothetical protein
MNLHTKHLKILTHHITKVKVHNDLRPILKQYIVHFCMVLSTYIGITATYKNERTVNIPLSTVTPNFRVGVRYNL